MNRLKEKINKQCSEMMKILQNDQKLLLDQVSTIEKNFNEKLNEKKEENFNSLDEEIDKKVFEWIENLSLDCEFKPKGKNINSNLIGEIITFQNKNDLNALMILFVLV